MKKKQKAGILGAMLLLPVFLYLLVSGSNRPVTEVPNEFNVNLKSELNSDFDTTQVHLYIYHYPKVVEDLLWFEGLLEKSECYELNLISLEKQLSMEYYDLKHSSNTIVSETLIKKLDSYDDFKNAFLVDEKGELRGVFDLQNLKDRERAKIELFILTSNNNSCQKSY